MSLLTLSVDNFPIVTSIGVGKPWPNPSATCFCIAREFMWLGKKNQKKILSWYVKILWNSNFSSHEKYYWNTNILIQFYIVPAFLYAKTAEVSDCDRDLWLAKPEIFGLWLITEEAWARSIAEATRRVVNLINVYSTDKANIVFGTKKHHTLFSKLINRFSQRYWQHRLLRGPCLSIHCIVKTVTRWPSVVI